MTAPDFESLSSDLWRMTPCRVAQMLTNGRYIRYQHIQFLSRKIAQAVMKGNARLIISVPPRHGKSWLTSLWTPVWFLGLSPEKNIILASYEADFAATWGRQVRNIFLEHGGILGVRLLEDSKASDRWNTIHGGGMITAGIGGPVTGRGGDLIIVDDPVKNSQEASSEIHRQKTIDWFNSTLYTRAEPGASIIVLMTRWHERDLVGYLTSEHADNWDEIRLPAIAEDGDSMGRPEGTPLCAERYDHRALEVIREAVGTRVWNSLYQQRPSAEEGNIFKREWWRYYTSLPESFDQVIQSWDLSFKETKTSDYVVGQVWGRVGADKYLIDQVRSRMDFTDTIKAIQNLSNRYPQAVAILVEDKANGPAVISALQTEISGLIPIEPNGSKESRAHSVSPEIESGNVYLPAPAIAPWIEGFIDEFANFPNGKNDDQVDAASQALLRLRQTIASFMPFSISSPNRPFQ